MLSAFAVYNSNAELKSSFKKKKLQQKSVAIKKKKVDPKRGAHYVDGVKNNASPKNDECLKKTALKPKLNALKKHEKIKEMIVCSPPLTLQESIRKKLRKNKVKTKRKSMKIVEIDSEVFNKPLDLLNYLLAPIDISDFFNTYWETKPLHIVRNKEDYFKNILSSNQLDKMLRENLLYYTKNVDVVTYENGERQTHNPEGRAIPANVWDYYMNGCSVRIMNPHTYNQKVRDLLSTLQEYFGTMVGVNVYLTPAGSQGFAPHYDDIEAFVIQLEGRKHWKIYAPRNNNEELPRYSSPNIPRKELQAPIKELTLHAGDLLYFPRGFIHEASTDSDAHSLHITVSVYQNTSYVDLLEKLLPNAIKKASENDISFRKGLPLNYLKHIGMINSNKKSPERTEILNNVKELIYKLVDYASVDMAADQMGQRSSKEDGDRMNDGIVKNIASFSPDTMVRFTRYYTQRLVLEESIVRIYYCTENANVYHGEEEQFLDLDNTSIDMITTLQNMYPHYITIEDLPGHDQIQKIQVISDLWERGLIVTKKPLEIEDE
ncbi:mina53 myc induced nuclear antigen [Holotrichia oblita]|uniref:Mina53 myc induced nuclear antigen n=1 Tax=Holotrichia oblita TaxID=644536 RepID=A0ACB9T937_HOLOL|nr:mina53 myc induced nuclear antigen [Holotrichia oblita]